MIELLKWITPSGLSFIYQPKGHDNQPTSVSAPTPKSFDPTVLIMTLAIVAIVALMTNATLAYAARR